MVTLRALFASICLCLIATSAFSSPDSDPGSSISRAPKLPVDGRNGSFTRVIPIELPDFRGIEPELRLVYDSASSLRNLPAAGAELGVGWSLQGLSAIQRVSGTPAPEPGQNKRPSGRGAPAYGAAGFPADSFMLDGSELVPCTEVPAPATTPSCATAGASGTVYTSRVETYVRIRQNPSANSWEVTGRDGVKSIYTSRDGAAFGQTYRWLLASVTDSRGNKVDYDWSCETGHCTIARIRAHSQGSGATASEAVFHTEARPDLITYGTGLGIRIMTRRISAIEVRSAGMLQSVYSLKYETSKSTRLSRLIEVRKFGSDATLGAGRVTGGTSLPPWRMNYSDNGDAEGKPAFTKREDWSGPGIEAIKTEDVPNLFGIPLGYPSTVELVGDFNGDGWATDHYLPKLCLPAKLDSNPNCGSTGRNPCDRGDVPGYVCSGGRLRLSNGNPALSSFRLVDFRREKVKGKLPDSDQIIASGDFNNDGATDFARVNSSPKEQCSSNACARTWVYSGIGFMNPANLPGGGQQTFFKPEHPAGMAGDFNGDGRDDFLLDDGRIMISGGKVVNWGLERISGFRKDYRFLVGDINGDSLSDVLINKEKTQTYRIYLSTGSGLVAMPSFNLPAGTNRQSLGDVNGDGLSDLIYSGPQGIGILFSDGRNLTAGPTVRASSGLRTLSASNSSAFVQFRMGDFNGDGRVDIVGNGTDNTSTGTGIAHSTGSGFESFPGILPGRLDTTVVADYNGDGADDVGRAKASPPIGVSDTRRVDNHIWLSTSGQADLLTSFREPLGGITSITYGSSARETSSALPFIMQVVKSLRLDDGRGGVSTLNFAYEGGAWSREERRFLGFRKVTTALPCVAGESACPQQVRTYEQTPGCAGQLSQEQVYDAPGGSLLSQVTTAYAADTQLPFSCLATSTEARTYAGGSSRAVSRSFTHDLYGNVTQVTDNGVVEAVGDETVTLTSFVPNTGDYLVSCPSRTLVYQGSSTSGSLLSGTSLSYDGGAPGQPPSRCEKTRQDDWTGDSNWITTRSWTYDGAGNRVTETDGAGNTTATVYDGSLLLYPIETRLPGAGLRTLTGWNLTCGLPSSETGMNGEVSRFSHDALCRETRRQLPGGYEEQRGYENLGQPTAQRQWVARSAPGGQSEAAWTADYLDGFGRIWFTASTGPNSGKTINVARSYNQRWGLARQTEPYHTDETPYWKSFGYDKLDRLVRTENPDGTATTISYGVGVGGTAELLVTTLTDEAGRRLIEAADADGKRVRRTRMKDAEPVTTRYQRDGLGRILRIIDPAGNKWAYAYDGLGRRTTVNVGRGTVS